MQMGIRSRAAAWAAALVAVVAASTSLGQTAIWTGAALDGLYTDPGNWQGGVVPANNGAVTLVLSDTTQYNYIYLTSSESVLGLQFSSVTGYPTYNVNSNGAALTIGASGISNPVGNGLYLYSDSMPIVLSASQIWNAGGGYIDLNGPISETGGSRSLLTEGNMYFFGNNTFSGGVDVISGTFYAGSSGAAGTGNLFLSAGTSLQTWYSSVNLANSVSLGNNVQIGSAGFSNNPPTLTLSGPVTFVSATSVLDLYASTSFVVAGSLSGPPGTGVAILGSGSQLPADGGSQMSIDGNLSQVTAINISNASLILGPVGNATSALASLSASGIQVSNNAYLGLDGTFTAPTAVSTFLANYGNALGATISGTLGFDTLASPGSPNTFDDPIDLTGFTSSNFVGLGSESSAILGVDAVITPYSDAYKFGGGGGTLTVMSDLTDDPNMSPRTLTLNQAPEPLTLILQGNNSYTGGTTVNGGVLIFDSPTPGTGGILLNGGYAGYTENAANIDVAQTFVDKIALTGQGGIIGFDSAVPSDPRTVGDPIDLSAFNGGTTPFIGTATSVTLTGSITPANHSFQFTGVKGGDLSVYSDLTGASNSVVIGLLNPIETNQGSSVVNITGPNNSYGGGTTINSGTVFFDNDTAFGTGPISVPDLAATVVAPYFAPFGGQITLANDFYIGAIQNGGPTPGLTMGDASGSDDVVVNGNIHDYAGQAGVLAIDGPVTLAGNNDYSGGTVITGNGNALLYVTNSSSLGLGSLTVQTYGILAASQHDVTLANNITLNSTLQLGENGSPYNLTLSGIISGQGSLDIQSNVELDGINSYSGGTSVSNALVTIGNASALGTGYTQLSNASIGFAFANPTVYNLIGDPSSVIDLAPAATLTIQTDNSNIFYFQGTITGSGASQVVKTGAGIQYLQGTGNYTGGTTVSAGTLIVGSDGAIGTGPVTVQSGAQLDADSYVTLTNSLTLNSGSTVGGQGTFAPPGGLTIAGGAEVMPGNNVGGGRISTLLFETPLIFGTNGVYGFNIQDAGGPQGTGYSTINVNGTLTIAANPSAPFTVSVISIAPGSGNAGLATFNAASTYQWTLISATTISGFAANDFVIDASGFQNPLMGGGFSIAQSGNTLVLDFTPVPEPSTWALVAVGVGAIAIFSLRRRSIGVAGTPTIRTGSSTCA
jgi:autotransporter-associated beta strand protein